MEHDLSMGNIHAILEQSGLAQDTVCGYSATWKQWLSWCDDHGTHPGIARRAEVELFLEQFDHRPRVSKRADLSAVYSKARPGEANPVLRNGPVMPLEQKRLETQFNDWARWCEKRDTDPLPADPGLVAEYLLEVVRKSYAKAEQSWRAIGRTSIDNGLPDPRRAEPAKQVIQTLRASPKGQPLRLKKARSPYNEKANQRMLGYWEMWCAEQGINPTSATSSAVLEYLQLKGETCGIHALSSIFYGLRLYFRAQGSQSNPTESQDCRDYLRAIKAAYSPSVEVERRNERELQRVLQKKAELETPYPASECIAHMTAATREKIMRHWKHWSDWCTAHNILPLEVHSEQLAAYLTELADHLHVSTVDQNRSSIATTYEGAASDVINPAKHILVRNVMKGLRRDKGKPPRQMTGLTDEAFARIQATAKRPREWETEQQGYERGTFDLALISVMRDGLLRVGEAAALHWADLEEDDDGSGTLYIARSKTDQTGEGAVVYVSKRTMAYLKDLRDLRKPDSDQANIFFKHGSSLYQRILRSALHAGLEGRYGGHSSRIGMAQDLAKANVTLVMIMNAGRWQSPEMPAYYIRKLSARQNAVARLYAHHPELTNLE